jgi:hypothetical protein
MSAGSPTLHVVLPEFVPSVHQIAPVVIVTPDGGKNLNNTTRGPVIIE